MQTEHMIEAALLSQGQALHAATRPCEPDPPKATSPARKAHRLRHDGEVVAISFVSASDLKAAFTSTQTGKFQELGFLGAAPPIRLEDDRSSTLPQQGDALKRHMRYLSPANDAAFISKAGMGRGSHLDLWLANNTAYLQWLSPSLDLPNLWIQGPSGCGKSACAARIIQRCLDKQPHSGNTAAVIYFSFCDPTEGQRAIATFLQNVISQLYTQRPELCARVPLLHIPLIEGVPLGSLWIALHSLLTHFEYTHCILDGMDNLDSSDQSILLRAILGPSSGPQHNIKVLAMSRQQPHQNPPSTSKPRWTVLEIPCSTISKDIRFHATAVLRDSQSCRTQPSCNLLDPELLVNSSMGSHYYIAVTAKTYQERLCSPLPQDMDSLLSTALERLYMETPLLRNCGIKILQWMIALPSPLTIQELDELLTLYPYSGRTSQDILDGCLRGLVNGPDSKGHVRFAAPSVRQFLISGTTDLRSSSSDSAGLSPVLPLKKARGDAAVDLLRYMTTSKFETQIQRQSPDDSARPGLATIAASRWIWLLTRAAPSAELVSYLATFMSSISFQKLFTLLAQWNPCLAVAQSYNLQLEDWLRKAQPLSNTRTVVSCRAECRKLVFLTIGKTLPADHAEVIMIINCLAQLHIDSQLFDTAEELFRGCLEVIRRWTRFTQSPDFERLPFFMFGHTIDEGQTLTLQDVHGRLLGLSDGAEMADLLHKTQYLSDSQARRNRTLARLQQMRKFKRYKLDSEAAAIYQEVKLDLLALRWDCSTPLDTILVLSFFLLDQGRDLEADPLLDARVPEVIRESGLVLICCSIGAGPDEQFVVELANARMDGLGTGWEAIWAIDRLARHSAGHGDIQSGIIFAKRAYQLSQRLAGLHDPRTLRCLQGMVNAHLAKADMDAVARMFSEIGSLSPAQMRELTPERPGSKMNYAIMMQQLGLPQLATSIVDELVSWLREQQALGYEARDTEHRNTVAINIGGFLTRLGRLQEAEGFLKRVLAEPEGLSHAQILAAKTNLAGCLRRQLRNDEADALYREINADESETVQSGIHEKKIFRIG
ncbi:hypothetical protein ASPVEDRAFT_89951 [Aspergillus versicolor CBS 583.65]|uniref:Nephrocystin 3-like N-terminal domain-containing protein n=1 Tax=Aspergillus versicolor CBS 583.65 TaxID=1036611 RepID=A0A1L9Q4N8_ASPVE|nr:uncharacterized protein ASPVEDRAFT_89951 [Aspergillus versicolor CBS 583.65]OJJ08743.1 hypothetical protein ASPVEDRAFT_89951 [Aspergillus versicolor CBS 583.65]